MLYTSLQNTPKLCRNFILELHTTTQKVSAYICAGSGTCFLGQDSAWLSRADNSPCHTHPLFLWWQNTGSSLTLRSKYLSNIVSQVDDLHTGQGWHSIIFHLVTATADRWWPQHDARWGWRSRSNITGQKKSIDGSSTNGISSVSEFALRQRTVNN